MAWFYQYFISWDKWWDFQWIPCFPRFESHLSLRLLLLFTLGLNHVLILFMLKWKLRVSSCVYTVKLIPNTFKHWFKKMKRQQTNLRSSPDSEAIGIKHTMVRRGTIVHKINELPCCRFHYIKWGCLQQNKKLKTFFVKNFTFFTSGRYRMKCPSRKDTPWEITTCTTILYI